MAKIVTGADRDRVTVNTNNVWERIVGIENSLDNVETNYTPRLTNVESQLAQKASLKKTNNIFGLLEKENLKIAIANGYDWTPVLRGIVAEIVSIGSGILFVPSGDFTITDTVALPSNIKIIGAGKGITRFVCDSSTLFGTGLFDIDSKSNCHLSDFSVINLATSGVTKGVMVRGNSSDITLERVHSSGFGTNLEIAGEKGTVSGTVTNIVLRSCKGDNGRNGYGVVFSNVDTALLEGFEAHDNWLDGIKLRAKTDNVRVVGGVSHHNRANGIDCYAGGHNVSLFRLECYTNSAAGIYIKMGDENRSGFSTYGYALRYDITDCLSHHNTNDGLQITRTSGALETEWLVPYVNIKGGYYYNNTGEGIYIRGVNISVIGATSNDNGMSGLRLAQALDVNISDVNIVHNGLSNIGAIAGVNIGSGKRINFISGTINGKDVIEIMTDAELAAKPASHGSSISIDGPQCDHVYIGKGVRMLNNTGSQPVSIQNAGSVPANTVIVIEQLGSLSESNGTLAAAGPGSLYTRTNQLDSYRQLYLKTTGYDANGWIPIVPMKRGTTVQRPATPSTGQPYYDTDIQKQIWYQGGWKDANGTAV